MIEPGLSQGNSSASQETRTAETAKDALQREVETIIAGASDYIEPHYRDDGTGQFKQIELTVPGQGERKERVVIGFLDGDPQNQVLTNVRPMSSLELPPGPVVRTLEIGFSAPSGQDITDYHLAKGEQNVRAEGAKFVSYPWNYPRMEQFGQNRQDVAGEDEVQRLRGKVSTATIEGKGGKPNLAVSTLLQRGAPPASAPPVPTPPAPFR